MGWLEAAAISALIIFLAGVVVVGFVLLMIWAMDRDKDIEMFIFIVVTITWIMFTIAFRTTG